MGATEAGGRDRNNHDKRIATRHAPTQPSNTATQPQKNRNTYNTAQLQHDQRHGTRHTHHGDTTRPTTTETKNGDNKEMKERRGDKQMYIWSKKRRIT